ncbi:uncharacterized protein LOC132279151 [Cornus florida]|uniref:uncharacterized protein LOC132279151 n=1 Tax=Cornus florida TaxID=4283 RepID=UPI0028978656|nr:uncharacterized protein LOC132279151 [Cornus florida]
MKKTQLLTLACFFFFILCFNVLPLCSCQTTSNMKTRGDHDQLMMQDQHLTSKNDTVIESSEEDINQLSLKALHEIIHGKKGVYGTYGNSDILRRPSRSGSSPVRPFSILSTTPLGHVTIGLLVLSFFFSLV